MRELDPRPESTCTLMASNFTKARSYVSSFTIDGYFRILMTKLEVFGINSVSLSAISRSDPFTSSSD